MNQSSGYQQQFKFKYNFCCIYIYIYFYIQLGLIYRSLIILIHMALKVGISPIEIYVVLSAFQQYMYTEIAAVCLSCIYLSKVITGYIRQYRLDKTSPIYLVASVVQIILTIENIIQCFCINYVLSIFKMSAALASWIRPPRVEFAENSGCR